MNDKQNKVMNILRLFRYCAFLFSLFVFFVGRVSGELHFMLCGALLIYIACILKCFENIRRHVVLFFLYVAVFVFLLSRPTISMIRGNVWWYYGVSGCIFALNAIYLSLICMYFGSAFIDRLLSDKGWYKNEGTSGFFKQPSSNSDFVRTLTIISGIGYYICFVFNILQGIEKLSFVSAGEYADIYVNFKSSLPFIVNAFAAMMPYFLCVYLACLPSKPTVYFALVVYVVSTLPTFLMGARNATVLALILALVYLVIRDYLNGTNYWIGRFEKTVIIIALPLALAFLGYYNYAREGTAVEDSGFMSLIVDFFYKQGVSFDVMCIAHNVMDELPNEVDKCYTFGGMIDYLKSNMFARELFGAISLGEGNNEIKAIFGNSFAHSLAYIAEPNYLSGHGLGSSYILETFADFGYIGVAVYSFLLSCFSTISVLLFKKGLFARIFILNCLTLFFIIPRAEATGFLNFILYLQFWVVVGFCLFFAYIIADKNLDNMHSNRSLKRSNNICLSILD